ncbi:MAG: ABC transporter ATP-binding protein [Pseudomonadota bacterium]|nr:ABC transporter ATP-binding protein [Pseudomonadota bacterium]
MIDKPEIVLSVESLSVLNTLNQKQIIGPLNFNAYRGEIIGVTGGSGSGKSALAYALLGFSFRNCKINSGSVFLNDIDLIDLEEKELEKVRGKEISLIVQNPRSALNPMYTIGYQISRVWNKHVGKINTNEYFRPEDMLKLVGINDPKRRINSFAHELSGGMAQRVLIALALSTKPSIIIADEPTSGLDVTVQAQFLDMIWKTSKDKGVTIILCTQDRGILANYCDTVIEMEKGLITKNEDVKIYFKNLKNSRIDEKIAKKVINSDKIIYKIKNLRKTFPIKESKKTLQAVENFSLSIRKNEIIGLVGESGSGKSTVGKCILKLINPDKGDLIFDEIDLGKISPNELRKLRKRIQIVQQDPHDSFDPRWRIEQSLMESFNNPSSNSKRKLNTIKKITKDFGIDGEVLYKYPKNVSPGVLQRLAIARAILASPDFVVLDEPTSLVAPNDRERILSLLKKIREDYGVSYLFISHDLRSVISICDKVAVMYLGQVVEYGSTKDIFNKPLHPYTCALVDSELGLDPNQRRIDNSKIFNLSGEIPSPVDLPSGCYLASRCPKSVKSCYAKSQKLENYFGNREVRCDQIKRIYSR